jgi:hypothetical protein
MGHDGQQSLLVIQGTYGLLRSRLEDMPQRAVKKLNSIVWWMPFSRLNMSMPWRSPPSDLGLCSGGYGTRTKMPPFKGASIFERRMPM